MIDSFLRLRWWLTLLLVTAGCSTAAPDTPQSPAKSSGPDEGILTLPALKPADLSGRRLQVVATTSLIGDVVGRLGGERIDLTSLMAAGQDPHTYEPAARDLTAVAAADVIFVNGWGLEEGLLGDLAAIAPDVPLVPISAGIDPLPLDEAAAEDDHENEEGHGHGAADPHVWFDVANVAQWVDNAAQILGQLDPAGADHYAQNAAAYLLELEALQDYVNSQVAAIPPEQRVLVTNHGSLTYFARAYGLTILGTVIPGRSTQAEPSASDLAGLVELMESRGSCTIFTESTANATLAQTAAAELDRCDEVRVLTLYTDALGPPGSGADSYPGLMRTTTDTIVNGLR